MSHAKSQDDSTLLAQLQDQKGRLSRLIGEAKKNHQDGAELIADMQQVSARIKQLQAAQKTPGKKTPAPPPAQPAPGHFTPASQASTQTTACRIVALDNTAADTRWQQRWNDYVSSNPRCTVYHRYEFKTIIQRAFQQTPHYLLALNTEEHIVGILPSVQLNSRLFGNFIISMPYFNYGGPIADHADIEQQLVQALIDKAQQLGIDHIELRETQPRAHYPARTDKAAMLFALPATEPLLWQQIGSKVRAQIKKAQNHGLTIRIGQQELLADFYRVFAENMRDLGTPVYSRDFFATLFDTLTDKAGPEPRLVIAYSNAGQAISAGLLISHQGTVEIPWASTLRSANSLNANMFLYWHVLAHSVNQRAAFFDFGRSSKEAGTFKFKKQWGAKPQQLFWHYWLPDNAPLPAITTNNPKYNLAIKLWQRLPVWLTRLIGPAIVKNIP